MGWIAVSNDNALHYTFDIGVPRALRQVPLSDDLIHVTGQCSLTVDGVKCDR